MVRLLDVNIAFSLYLSSLGVFLHNFMYLLLTHGAIYWQCQSVNLSVTPTSVMMVSYKLYVVCVVLCTVNSVHSLLIRGTIRKNRIEVPSEVAILYNYINGEDFNKVVDLTLNRLELEADETVPTLNLVNFKFIDTLKLTNLGLEHVPVFKNTTCVDIRITGNNITSVPANAFSVPHPVLLDLSNNEIQTMADRSVNMGASVVVLSCNQLTNFSSSWFEEPDKVDSLNLQDNRIEYIQDRAFSEMTKLFWLFLSHNHIKSIGSEAFPSQIAYLNLPFNDIALLTPEMFADRDMPMVWLDIHQNQLSYLPEALLVKLKLRTITLFDNPWQCQCLRDIERWLREHNSERYDIPARRSEPACVRPVNFQYVCISVVDTELQQTYAKGLSSAQGCWATGCKPCNYTKDTLNTKLT